MSKVVYSEHWQSLQTGRMLFRMPLPNTTDNMHIEVIYEQPPAKDRIFEARVSKLDMVPSEDIALHAVSLLTKAEEDSKEKSEKPWGIHVVGIGKFSAQAVRLLRGVLQTRAFVNDAKELLAWIDKEPSKTDFVDWFHTLLLDTPGILAHRFQSTPGVPLHIKSIFSIRDENYIDDEVVRSALEVFSLSYEGEGRYLFVSPIQQTMWELNKSWHWKKEQIQAGVVEKAFFAVFMKCHWGVLEVDFLSRKISFGDSLSWPVPNDTVKLAKEWIRHCGVDLQQWDRVIGKFDVPQQPAGSGSCAVNALNAIETSINPAIERWTHSRSAHHRLRLLELVSGYKKVTVIFITSILSLYSLCILDSNFRFLYRLIIKSFGKLLRKATRAED
jgi:hypothetical protein